MAVCQDLFCAGTGTRMPSLDTVCFCAGRRMEVLTATWKGFSASQGLTLHAGTKDTARASLSLVSRQDHLGEDDCCLFQDVSVGSLSRSRLDNSLHAAHSRHTQEVGRTSLPPQAINARSTVRADFVHLQSGTAADERSRLRVGSSGSLRR